MAVELLTNLMQTTFSGFEAYDSAPYPQRTLSRNFFRVSIWGTISSGATALVSFIFSKTLRQEDTWKTFALHFYGAHLFSCGTFAAFAIFAVYQSIITINPPENVIKALHQKVSDCARTAAMVGLMGTTAAWTMPIEKHLYSFLGLGAAGSILWLFLNNQNQQLAIMDEKTNNKH